MIDPASNVNQSCAKHVSSFVSSCVHDVREFAFSHDWKESRRATFPSLFNNTVIARAPAAGYTAGHDFVHDQKGKVSAARNTRKITRKIRGWFPSTVRNLCLSCIKIARNY